MRKRGHIFSFSICLFELYHRSSKYLFIAVLLLISHLPFFQLFFNPKRLQLILSIKVRYKLSIRIFWRGCYWQPELADIHCMIFCILMILKSQIEHTVSPAGERWHQSSCMGRCGRVGPVRSLPVRYCTYPLCVLRFVFCLPSEIWNIRDLDHFTSWNLPELDNYLHNFFSNDPPGISVTESVTCS